jgi:cytoskeletal protein CcmA (bactofilin family)
MFGRRRGHSVGPGLVVGPEDAVEGTMTAEAVTVVGRVDGTLHVATTLQVEPTGRVHGTVRAARLVVDAGATVRAAVRIGVLPEAAPADVMRLTPRSTRRVR